MTAPLVALVAHYSDSEGRRILSLPIVTLNPQGALIVLFDNRLMPATKVTEADATLKLDRIEYVEPYVDPALLARVTASPEKVPAAEVIAPVKPKKASAGGASPIADKVEEKSEAEPEGK